MAVSTVRRSLDFILAGCLLVIPALILSASFKDPAKVNVADRVVLRVSAPLQRGAAWVIGGVGGLWNHYVWLVDVDEENQELRRENQRLALELAEAKRRKKDDLERMALVDLKERLPAETIGARVIAVGTNPSFRVTRIVLDRGAGEVAPGMAVIAPEGVVGRIERVYGSYADVQLAIDPDSAIDVVVQRTGARGMLKGMGSDNGYLAKVENFERSEDVQKDDLLVTSGFGGFFPRDVPAGKITRVSSPAYELYHTVEVEPVVDFSRLHKVLVVVASPPPPDPTAKLTKTPEAAFGVGPTGGRR